MIEKLKVGVIGVGYLGKLTSGNSDPIHEKLFALYSVTLEKLMEYFKGGSFDEFSIKPNEFQVFGAFWVTACCLRSNVSGAHEAIENFNKSIVVSIIDTIIDKHPEDIEEERQKALNETITNVFVERFSLFHKSFQADTEKVSDDGLVRFPRLTHAFFSHVFDKPPAEDALNHQLLDATLNELLHKSEVFFSGR